MQGFPPQTPGVIVIRPDTVLLPPLSQLREFLPHLNNHLPIFRPPPPGSKESFNARTRPLRFSPHLTQPAEVQLVRRIETSRLLKVPSHGGDGPSLVQYLS